jgi:Zn-dependent M28 family amino/carboxypeptidase
MRRDITFLASDQCEGRGVDTNGINLAAAYIAEQFREAGLKPVGPADSYFQDFKIPGATLSTPNCLALRGPQGQVIELVQGSHFQVMGLSTAGKVNAPLVFLGYGLSTDKVAHYDDYQNTDVAGKIVVVLRDMPRAGNRYFSLDPTRRSAAMTSKILNAEKHGAAAIWFVNDATSADGGDDLLPFSFTAFGSSSAKLPALHVRRQVVNALIQSSLGTRLAEIEEAIDRGLQPVSGALAGWTAAMEVTVQRAGIPVKNVIGVLEGAGPLAQQTVILGAHYDHLGYGGFGSLGKGKKPAIHHGADDNGSGTTALMELARRFAKEPGLRGRRLVFMAFSAEECGLLGSAYYCKNPTFPLGDTVAMINMDMVGRLRKDQRGPWSTFVALLAPAPDVCWALEASSLIATLGGPGAALQFRDKMTVYGTGTSASFSSLIDSLNQRYAFKLNKIPGGFGPSDHASFYAKKIPVFFFFTDDHDDYHRPSDTADKINFAGMARVTDIVRDLVTNLDTTETRPAYVKTGGENRDLARYAGMPRLSLRPGNYGEEDGGLLVGGVIDGGAAARAGIKEGDRIVRIAGQGVKNVTGYMNVMATLSRGKPIEIVVLREGKQLTVMANPD